MLRLLFGGPMNVAEIKQSTEQALGEIAAASPSELEALRIKYLGRKDGVISGWLRALKDVPAEQRAEFGQAANTARAEVEAALDRKLASAGPAQPKGPVFDPTLPGRRAYMGTRHPVSHSIDTICHIFERMGFVIADGPEVESDYYNFEALNFPPDHPARDMQDTFFVQGGLLLRTHTSPVQIRSFEKRRPPVKIICPGRVYRNEAINARSYCMFHQVEGFYVDTDVTFGDLKGVLLAFAHAYFGPNVELRFRPSYFPFTEPSTEVDVSCYLCSGKGCAVCKYEGWLEILGAGMIHPKVFEAVGYDPEKYSGYAFGMGVDRSAMQRYGIDDIRLMFENDVRFLRQFVF
jgi:phenylalanyl-tRNA synthetase alpha chain